MLSVEKREQIRRAYLIEQKSKRQIAQELHRSRHTIAKALASAESGQYTLHTPYPAPVLGPYKARIDELLTANERVPRKQRYTSHKPDVSRMLVSLLLSSLLLSLASGCTPRPQLDRSLLTGDPCVAPCWHDIVPGVSTEEDVRSQLERSPFVRKGTLDYALTEQTGVSLSMFTWLGCGKTPNRVYLRDGRVLSIEIRLDYDLTLGEIVDKYGPPERIYAVVHPVEVLWYGVDLYYPSRGLMFSSSSAIHSSDIVDGTGPLSEDMKVTGVYYYSPTTLQDTLTEVLLLPADWVEYRIANMQEWEGFGRVMLANRGE